MFTELLGEGKILIFDGGFGTQLAQRGAKPGGESNITSPGVVEDVHKAYIAAGSNVIITNTFCMNRYYMASNGVNGSVEEINRAGVEIARRAAGGRAAVMGDIGPTGKLLKPIGELTEDEMYEAFSEQAAALASAGVDGFIIETMISLKEAVVAVRACKDAAKLPIAASMTYATARDGGRTTMGDKAAACAAELEKAGADVLGSNCGDLDPQEVAIVVASYRSVSNLPVLVEPNAGKPKLDENDKAVYEMKPGDFAEGVKACIAAGARLLGGCCGTTPDHIRALVEMVSAM